MASASASASASATTELPPNLLYGEGKIEGMRALAIVSSKQQFDHVDIENATGLTPEDLKSALAHLFEIQIKKRSARTAATGAHPLHTALANCAMGRLLSEAKLDDLVEFPSLYAETGAQLLVSLRALESMIEAVRNRVCDMLGKPRVEAVEAARTQRASKAAAGKRGMRKSARLEAKTK